MCNVVKTGSGRLIDFRSAILNAGYRVSLSHAHKLAIKTDAPNAFVWDMMRAWHRLHPANPARVEQDPVAKAILEKEQLSEVSFETHLESNPKSREKQLRRFQVRRFGTS